MSAVFKTKLRPRFIGPFTVVAKKGLAYTLNLPRKLRTHPVFYVGMLKPYRDPSHVDSRALAPRMLALPRDVASESGGQAGPQHDSDASPSPEVGRDRPRASSDAIALRSKRAGFDPKSLEEQSPLSQGQHGLQPIHRPPPALLDKHGNRQFHVERLLKRRRRNGQYQYLVKWRGYPESENSWEYEVPLRQDCPYAIDVFERSVQGQPELSDASHQ